MGHSFGGTTAIATSLSPALADLAAADGVVVRGCIALDGWAWPLNPAAFGGCATPSPSDATSSGTPPPAPLPPLLMLQASFFVNEKLPWTAPNRSSCAALQRHWTTPAFSPATAATSSSSTSTTLPTPVIPSPSPHFAVRAHAASPCAHLEVVGVQHQDFTDIPLTGPIVLHLLGMTAAWTACAVRRTQAMLSDVVTDFVGLVARDSAGAPQAKVLERRVAEWAARYGPSRLRVLDGRSSVSAIGDKTESAACQSPVTATETASTVSTAN